LPRDLGDRPPIAGHRDHAHLLLPRQVVADASPDACHYRDPGRRQATLDEQIAGQPAAIASANRVAVTISGPALVVKMATGPTGSVR